MHFKNAIIFVSFISFLFNFILSKHTYTRNHKTSLALKLNNNLKSNNKNLISLNEQKTRERAID